MIFVFVFVQLKSPYYYYLYSPSCTRFIYPILTHQSSDLLLGASNCEQLVLYTQACAKIEGGKDKKKEREKSEYMFVAIYTKRQEKKKRKQRIQRLTCPPNDIRKKKTKEKEKVGDRNIREKLNWP